MSKARKQGFTMMEIIIVVAIIAILAGIAVPVVGSVMEEARISKAKSEVEKIAKAILALYEDTSFWPTDNDISSLAAWNADRNGILGNSARGNSNYYPNWKGPYLSKRLENDPWGTSYLYDGGGRVNRSEINPGQTSVMSYGPNRQHNGSRDRNDMTSQGDDIVHYFQ